MVHVWGFKVRMLRDSFLPVKRPTLAEGKTKGVPIMNFKAIVDGLSPEEVVRFLAGLKTGMDYP
ncbi:hypothetical protein, partial [Pseudomonas sp.]|uniref:hypothetical protein n=1 Tax=Pseudomonas sp. TaxID=306 RepID=UPI00258A29E4